MSENNEKHDWRCVKSVPQYAGGGHQTNYWICARCGAEGESDNIRGYGHWRSEWRSCEMKILADVHKS